MLGSGPRLGYFRNDKADYGCLLERQQISAKIAGRASADVYTIHVNRNKAHKTIVLTDRFNRLQMCNVLFEETLKDKENFGNHRARSARKFLNLCPLRNPEN